jgi:endonuclease YncB( thermonuclease family)
MSLAAAQAPPPVRTLVGRTVDARVVRIADGDSLELVLIGQRERVRVRLEGVDAPELGEVFSRDAQTFLSRLLFDQQVRLNGRDVDRYGRLVARVDVGGRDASLVLLEAGLACQRFAVDKTLAAAEAQARAAGRGFWAANAPKPQCVARGTRIRKPRIPRMSQIPPYGRAGGRGLPSGR